MYKARDGDGENNEGLTSCECHYEGKLIDGTVLTEIMSAARRRPRAKSGYQGLDHGVNRWSRAVWKCPVS